MKNRDGPRFVFSNGDRPHFSRRRALLIAVAAAPLAARAQLFQDKVRRVGVLLGYSAEDLAAQVRLAAFRTALAARGWEEGRNLKTDVRWTGGDANLAARFAAELVALKPEVILSNTTPVTAALLRETRSIAIVFTIVSDPVGSGFVKSLARPDGNVTGFINIEASLAEKWVQLLAQLAPKMKRAAVMFNPKTAPYAEYYLSRLSAAGSSLGVTTFIAAVTSPKDIEEAIAMLGRDRTSGLIVMTDSYMLVNRDVIIAAAARRKVPAMYPAGEWSMDGGLVSYGVDAAELFRRSGAYVDRILRGAKPADLPVEQPSKFELFINAKSAKALGLAIPQPMLLRADKVIE